MHPNMTQIQCQPDIKEKIMPKHKDYVSGESLIILGIT